MSDPRAPRDAVGLPIPLPDSDDCPPQLRERVDAYFAGELSDSEVMALFAALRDDPAGQQAYNEAALASRLLDGGPERLARPSAAELRGVEQAVLERVRLDPDAQPARTPSRWLAWIGGLVAVGVAVVIALPFLRGADAPPHAPDAPHGFQARGQQARWGKKVGLRLFCSDEGPHGVRELRATPEAPVPWCKLTATLKFAITNRSALDHLFLVGVDSRRQISWYEPTPPTQASVPIEKNIVDAPLERAVRLAVNHRRGMLRVYAIFSARPLAAKRVQAAIAKSSKSALEALAVLPIDDTEQRSALIELK